MFCLILAHPWSCILTVMLRTFCLKYLGKSLKEKLVKKKKNRVSVRLQVSAGCGDTLL